MKKIILSLMICLTAFSIISMKPNESYFIQEVNAKSISLTRNLTLKNIRSYKLKVKGTNKKTTWSSSNKKIATVSSNGTVKAVKNGTCYVYAKVSGKKLKCKVTVKSPTIPTSVKLNKTNLTLTVNSSSTLKATVFPTNVTNKNVTWNSSDKNIATVQNGKIVAKKAGTATITVKTTNGKKATCKVTVKNAPTKNSVVNADAVSRLKTAKNTNKIMIVSTTSSSTSNCVFQYFEKTNGKWKEVVKVNGYVGRRGIDKVKEGDKKTPTGVFYFRKIMGIAKNPGGTILPYKKIDKNDYWCGEQYYNQFVDEDVTKHKCSKKEDEHLIDYTIPYQYFAFFNFNSKNIKGKGCSIFLHCFGSKKYTAGCIAIPKETMKQMIRIIDTDTAIIIDQRKNISIKY